MSDVRAFPRAHDGHEGMTLRDYFAARAMNGFIVRIGAGLAADEAENLAANSYAIADAMLEARKLGNV